MQIAPHLPTTARRVRPAVFVAVGAGLAVIVAVLLIVATGFAASFALTPFAPRAQDGLIPEGAAVTLDDDHLPALANLDPSLLGALRDAGIEARGEGVTFEITSGWRSREYQGWLLAQAVETYGSEEIARQFVAPPEESAHAKGDAVDIVPVDAQSWLSQHGAQFGLCQVYANEPWHYQRTVEAGGVCPEMMPDASTARAAADQS